MPENPFSNDELCITGSARFSDKVTVNLKATIDDANLVNKSTVDVVKYIREWADWFLWLDKQWHDTRDDIDAQLHGKHA